MMIIFFFEFGVQTEKYKEEKLGSVSWVAVKNHYLKA